MLMFMKLSGIKSFTELYRFISVFLTAAIYFAHGLIDNYSISNMLALLICIVIFTFLVNYLYKFSYDNRTRLHLLLLIETLGLLFIIWTTGGLYSPFVWCAFNPIIIISYFIYTREKYFLLAAWFILLGIDGYIVDKPAGIREYLLSNYNILLSFLVLTILINILFEYNQLIIKKQEELTAMNKTLTSFNNRIKGMISDILYMYETVRYVPGQKSSSREIIRVILEFAERVCPEASSFFVPPDGESGGILTTSRALDRDIENVILGNLKLPEESDKPVVLQSLNGDMTALLARVANFKNYGIVGLLMPGRVYCESRNEYETTLLLISQLGAAFFEKYEAEDAGFELAISMEQERIASDIHDNVIQRLFSASSFAYSTLSQWEQLTDAERKEQMKVVMESTQSSLKDLRSTIYNLADRKQQFDHIRESISDYLKELEKLSKVKINMSFVGNANDISISARRALYRIITECTGNAVKHAGCSNIWVDIDVGDMETSLKIRDDGIGLDFEKAEREKRGLGITNIKSLVRIFNGKLEVSSVPGLGTTFDIRFDNYNIMNSEG